MTTLLSSPEATAIANLLVFVGVVFAVIRVGRTWWTRLTARYSVASRKIRRKQILVDLRRIKTYRGNKIAAIRDASYGVFDDIVANVALILGGASILLIYISIDTNNKANGPDYRLWTEIYAGHEYWFAIWTMIFVGMAILITIFSIGTRRHLRFLKFAADPEASRRDIIDQYLKIRPRR